MKLRILSDLHIEHYPYTIVPLPEDRDTGLILAGDIGSIAHRAALIEFLDRAGAQFRFVVYVCGNHEFYATRWPEALGRLREARIPENVHLLECETLEIEDVTFVGTTLWTDFDRQNPWTMRTAEDFMADYQLIAHADRSEPRRLHANDILQHHYQSRAWLKRTLASLHAAGRKAVLVTHHGVSPGSIAPYYRGNALNGAFSSDLTRTLRATRPLLAAHGHVHDSFDYWIGKPEQSTRVVVNPRGYAKWEGTQENRAFNPTLTIEV